MTVGGLTGGLVLAYGIANRTMQFSFSGYEIYPIVVTVAGIAGGLAPDVDMARSKAGKSLRKALRGVMIISALLLVITFLLDRAGGVGAGIDRQIPLMLAAFCVLIMFIIEKSKHRGFTHTPVGLLVIMLPLIYMLFTKPSFAGADIAVSAQIGFAMGWFSHMVIDTFNYPGTPWLWPVVNNHFNIMRIDSGTSGEHTFLLVCAAGFAVCYVLMFM